MAFPAQRPHPSNEEALSGALEACTHASTVFSSIASPKFLSSKSSSHTLESTHCRLYTPDPQPACRASEPLLEPCRWSTNVPHSSVHSFIHHSIRRHKTIACTHNTQPFREVTERQLQKVQPLVKGTKCLRSNGKYKELKKIAMT